MSNILTQDFAPSSASAWKQKIQVELNGADYNHTLLSKTNEGITISPFYHSNNFEKLEIPIPKEGFKICYKINIPIEKTPNKQAVNAIKKGATALKFIANKPFNIKNLFENLLNKQIEFHFQLEFLNEEFLNKLVSTLKNETSYFNIDIIENLIKNGNWYTTLNNDFKAAENLIQENTSKFVLGVNVELYQNAGANAVQQIAYAIAHANEYLNKFGSSIADKIQFNFAIGSNYFFEIAKIRAFRYLYNLILKEYNTQTVAKVYTEPSLRNKILYDYNENLLRTTTESMSAILGGANTISNTTYNSLFHTPNEFGEQIAHNQLIFLKEESGFKNMQHIATDSYYIESITKQMAEKALDIFKDIEKSGGFLNQLKEGTIQRKIKENAQKEQDQFDKGEINLIETNKITKEHLKENSDLQLNNFIGKKSHKTLIIPIIPKRLSEKLEQKMLKNEA